MMKRKEKTTDDQSDNNNNNTDSTGEKKQKVEEAQVEETWFRVSSRTLTVVWELKPNPDDGTVNFVITSLVNPPTPLKKFTGPVTLMSRDSKEVALQYLKELTGDAEEYKNIQRNYHCPTEMNAAPDILLEDDEQNFYFDTEYLYYKPDDTTTLYLDEVHYNLPKRGQPQNTHKHIYIKQDGKLPLARLLANVREGGGGFGAARSDPPGDYVWFGNAALGYALGLECADTHYLGPAARVAHRAQATEYHPRGLVEHNSKKYYRTNVPQDVTTKIARNATLGSQQSEIIYYKVPEQSRITEGSGKDTTYRRPNRTKALYRRAPEKPHIPRIPDRTVILRIDTSSDNNNNNQTTDTQTNTQTTNTQTTNSQTTNSQTTNTQTNTQTTNASTSSGTAQTNNTGSNGNAPPPEPSGLFGPVVEDGGYTSKKKGPDEYTSNKLKADYKEEYRKKAKLMTLLFSSGDRDDTATEVFKAVNQPYRQSVNDFTAKWRERLGQTPHNNHLPATAYCDYLIRHYPNVRQALRDLSTNNPPDNSNTNNSTNSNNNNSTNNNDPYSESISTDQEWCHLFGHAGGGEDSYRNFVSGSHYANTEQLAIELAQRRGRYPNLKVSVTAYRLFRTDIALWIRYKIFHRGIKIFDHVFDGQSESFDYNEFKILETTVQRVIAHSVATSSTFRDAENNYAARINARIKARWKLEQEESGKANSDQPPPYAYALPQQLQTNVNSNNNNSTNSNTTTNTTTTTTTTTSQQTTNVMDTST